MNRAEMRARRRLAWHEGQVSAASTPRQQLWKACGWLVSEAWRANRLDEALEHVLTLVHEIRDDEREEARAA